MPHITMGIRPSFYSPWTLPVYCLNSMLTAGAANQSSVPQIFGGILSGFPVYRASDFLLNDQGGICATCSKPFPLGPFHLGF